MFGADAKYKGKEKDYDLHLTDSDFWDIGKDFCKAIFSASTSSVLRWKFYPVSEISPFDDSVVWPKLK